MSNTSVNYIGRQVDLSIFPDLSQPNVAADARIGDSPKVVAGPLAMAQNFLRALMTPLGHYKSDPKYGSNFQSKVSTRTILYPIDLAQIFQIESSAVIEWMRQNGSALPLDEQISSVELADYSLGRTYMSLTINITSRAGASVVFRLPVNWTF